MSDFYFNPNGNFLFTQEEYDNAPTDSVRRLPVKCLHCGETFYIAKATLKQSIKNYNTNKKFLSFMYCSTDCRRAENPRLQLVTYNCAQCGKEVNRPKWTIHPTKTGQLFCSPTCSNKWKHDHDFVREKFIADISQNPNGNFLFSQEEYEENISPQKLHNKVLSCRCINCGNSFYISAYDVNDLYQRKNKTCRWLFCSWSCLSEYRSKKQEYTCDYCGKKIYRSESNARTFSGRHFCSQTCSRQYQKEHPTEYRGGSRSNIEKLFCYVINDLMPEYKQEYNNRKVLDGFEVDLYLPELILGVEFNGITHYKDVYNNPDKFERRQERDRLKLEKAKEKRVALYVMDISDMNSLYPTTAVKYLINKLLPLVEYINQQRNSKIQLPADIRERILQIIYNHKDEILSPSILKRFNWNNTSVIQ